MQKRPIGQTGIEIAPIMFGGSVFGWSADEPTSFALMDAFVDHGFNCIDTADVYSLWVPGNSGGESETIIGKWIAARGSREKVVLATKCGSPTTPGGGGLRAGHILQSAEDSLRRLRTDYIDLYQAHRDDKVTPPDETLAAYARLIEQGKVRAIGASNYEPERFRESLAASARANLPRYQTLQLNYNLYDRGEFESELEALCLEEGVGVISYFSLASGFLTGKYRSEADLTKSNARGADVKKYLNARGMRILVALDNVAERHPATPAQIALAWLIARPSITAPIVSATSISQLRELLHSTEVLLEAEDVARLDFASAYE
jgi:aryl-alcohol dehydrogenase-like predicted oxidoreductase